MAAGGISEFVQGDCRTRYNTIAADNAAVGNSRFCPFLEHEPVYPVERILIILVLTRLGGFRVG